MISDFSKRIFHTAHVDEKWESKRHELSSKGGQLMIVADLESKIVFPKRKSCKKVSFSIDFTHAIIVKDIKVLLKFIEHSSRFIAQLISILINKVFAGD